MNNSVTYTTDVARIMASSLDGGFFVGWQKAPSPETHLQILKGSHVTWLAMHEGRCVGFINAISDGVLSAFIPLLEVLPEYQGQGIGSELVLRIKASLKEMYAVDVVCDDELVPFYERHGLRRTTAMVLRNYANQSGRVE